MQKLGEKFYETWERFKDLLKKYPHYEIVKLQINRVFYDGILEQNKKLVDATCGGAFMSKDEDEMYQLYETLSENSTNRESFALYDHSIGQ